LSLCRFGAGNAYFLDRGPAIESFSAVPQRQIVSTNKYLERSRRGQRVLELGGALERGWLEGEWSSVVTLGVFLRCVVWWIL